MIRINSHWRPTNNPNHVELAIFAMNPILTNTCITAESIPHGERNERCTVSRLGELIGCVGDPNKKQAQKANYAAKIIMVCAPDNNANSQSLGAHTLGNRALGHAGPLELLCWHGRDMGRKEEWQSEKTNPAYFVPFQHTIVSSGLIYISAGTFRKHLSVRKPAYSGFCCFSFIRQKSASNMVSLWLEARLL